MNAEPEPAEEWRPVKGQPLYEVSDLGRIRSWAVGGHAGMRAKRPRILIGCKCGIGYRAIEFSDGSRRYIHRMVLEEFVGPCPDGMECRHLNGDLTRNRLDNLRWGSAKENSEDKRRHGTTAVGTKNPQAKLTPETVREIRATKGTCKKVGEMFGVSPMTISRVRNRQLWSHVQ